MPLPLTPQANLLKHVLSLSNLELLEDALLAFQSHSFRADERMFLWECVRFDSSSSYEHTSVVEDPQAPRILSLLIEQLGDPFANPSPTLLHQWADLLTFGINLRRPTAIQHHFLLALITKSKPFNDYLYQRYLQTHQHPIAMAAQNHAFQFVQAFVAQRPELLQSGFSFFWHDEPSEDTKRPLDCFNPTPEAFFELNAIGYDFTKTRYATPSILSAEENLSLWVIQKPDLSSHLQESKKAFKALQYAGISPSDDFRILNAAATLSWNDFHDEAWSESFITPHYRQQFDHPLHVALSTALLDYTAFNETHLPHLHRLLPLAQAQNENFLCASLTHAVRSIANNSKSPLRRTSSTITGDEHGLLSVYQPLRPFFQSSEMVRLLISTFDNPTALSPIASGLLPGASAQLVDVLMSCGPSFCFFTSQSNPSSDFSPIEYLLSNSTHLLHKLPITLCRIELSKLRGNSDHHDLTNTFTPLPLPPSEYLVLFEFFLKSKEIERFEFFHFLRHSQWPSSIPLDERFITQLFGAQFCKEEFHNIQNLVLSHSAGLSVIRPVQSRKHVL